MLRAAGPLAGVGVGALALFPLVPRLPYAEAAVRIPAYFTDGASSAIPQGSVVLSFPYPVEKENLAMNWQDADSFRFRLMGGYVLTPLQLHGIAGGGPGGGDVPPTLVPPIVQILFYEGFAGVPKGVVPPPPLPWAFAQVKDYLDTYDVSTIVAQPDGVDPSLVLDFFEKMFNEPPKHVGGVEVWYHVRSLARRAPTS